jgi:hypothetical protein
MSSLAFKLVPLYPTPINSESIPLYSYERPSELFWTGVHQQLMKMGLTYDQAVEMLQNKSMRYMLDNFGDELETLGAKMVEKYFSTSDVLENL